MYHVHLIYSFSESLFISSSIYWQFSDYLERSCAHRIPFFVRLRSQSFCVEVVIGRCSKSMYCPGVNSRSALRASRSWWSLCRSCSSLFWLSVSWRIVATRYSSLTFSVCWDVFAILSVDKAVRLSRVVGPAVVLVKMTKWRYIRRFMPLSAILVGQRLPV